MDIGEVIKLSGLPASTLRFYEEKQLIQPIGRHGLRRVYDAGILQRLALISLGRNAGFSLEEIASMLTSKGVDIDRKQLIAKADEIDRRIKQLSVMRDGLRHAAECPAPSHLECPTFLRILNMLDKAQLKKRKGLKMNDSIPTPGK
ncbi:helix-turn-helix domain-containing protein [Hahella aquimaris]|nr:helix-turn-helix domain-containing protein [Hahella sp. HNIBRBA332]WLQ17450.1 helix-turn-helix domain-containing protein [Hahella sp. HNIBRBA332]